MTAAFQTGDYGEIQVDMQHWPLMIVTPPVRVSDETMLEFLARHREIEAERAEPYVLILDLRYCDKISSSQREMLTDGMADTEDTPCKALAMIFSSRILRGILSMIFWVRKPPYPTRVFATPEEAFPWAREEHARALKEMGLDAANLARTGRTYFVQCEASLSADKAAETCAQAKAHGYPAEVTIQLHGERTMHTPRVGPFESWAEATRVAGELSTAGLHASVLALETSAAAE